MSGPLSDIRVVESASYITGPFTGQMLADLGANVIKVEPPGKGDPFRGDVDQYSAAFVGHNHGKRSLTLDLKAPEALEVFDRLIAAADVFVENFRPGVTQRLKIHYDRLQQINPRLIYCSI